MTPGIWAAVPIKDTKHSKQRLATTLNPTQRQLLALTMFEDVMTALHGAPSLAGIIVVTIDAQAAALAQRFGASVITEDALDGHTAAVLSAGRALRNAGCAGMLALPGDVPGVTSGEIETLLAAHGPAPSLTIVPSHDELGSNAVLASPPGIVALRFGDNSFWPHLAAAKQAGVPCRSLELPGIALDLDNEADLTAFVARPSTSQTLILLRQMGFS